MNAIRNSSSFILLVFVLLLSVTGCKSKKKAMEAAAAEKARMEQEAAAQKQREEEERKRKEAEAEANAKRQNESSASAKTAVLAKYFDSIATASNSTAANNSISEALTMFSSPETPVLIIISGQGDQKDYDRPTTIMNYLNYLKDQKKNANKVENLKYDASGKITEVELRKN